jgi:spore coat polysaccharide biosynthesis protein SpsF
MSTLVVIQARTGSTRLPGKVLLPLAGRTLLERMIERVLAAGPGFDVVVATTTEPGDEAVAAAAACAGVRSFGGHPTDLLDRHYRAALEAGADTVVKIPSDCPLVDPAAIRRVLARHRDDPADYTSNLHPASWPDGNDVEIMTIDALAAAHREATRPLEREHTTPFLWERPERFRVSNVRWETGHDFSMSHRLTVDYPADYELVAAVYEELWSPARPVFPLADVLRLLDARPDIFAKNARYAGVNWYRRHLHELRTITAADTRLVEEAP